MVPLQGEAAAQGGRSDRFDVPAEAVAERLRRRTAALERQLDARIAEVAGLQARLAEERGPSHAARDDAAEAWSSVEALQAKAAQYDALMNTVTMRALRLPRSWYAALRRRFGAAGA